MIGRLIFECDTDGAEPWETELPAILRENRRQLFAGEDASTESVGGRIIGSNLARLALP